MEFPQQTSCNKSLPAPLSVPTQSTKQNIVLESSLIFLHGVNATAKYASALTKYKEISDTD